MKAHIQAKVDKGWAAYLAILGKLGGTATSSDLNTLRKAYELGYLQGRLDHVDEERGQLVEKLTKGMKVTDEVQADD